MMERITKNDILQHKKRVLQDLQYYQKLFAETENRLEVINDQITKLETALSFSKMAADPRKEKLQTLFDEKGNLLSVRLECKNQIIRIIRPLEQFKEDEKELVESLCIKCMNYKEASEKYGIPAASLFRKINALLDKYDII